MSFVPFINELEQIPKPIKTRRGWGYCGIAAMSAATGIPPLTIYNKIPNWPGYTPSYMIKATLKEFGYTYIRELVAKYSQRAWPCRISDSPLVALGRLYFGDGKYASSHWICFRWTPTDMFPGLYDSALNIECWIPTGHWDVRDYFMENSTKLKSLYFIEKM